jgi:putative SOS response-associated peptidase YedK
MCGRFVLFSDLKQIQLAFDVEQTEISVKPSYNVAPTHPVLVVVQRAGANTLETMRWGLIPSWATDAKIGARMINARAETVAEKPSFKRSLQKRRCLIIADGFYEWRTEQKQKIPMYIRRKSNGPLGFAGLYDSWKSSQGETITSCAIITTTANEMIKSIHDRMPVILPKAAQQVWLDSANQDIAQLMTLLKPYPSEDMETLRVSPLVNSPQNNSIDCIQPVD